MHVYVLDTAVALGHVEFGGRATSGYDFIDNDLDAGEHCAAAGSTGHGTHVSGIIGGTVSGVAKNVQIVAVRVLDCSGSGAFSAVLAGVNWVTANAVRPAVANMSLGGLGSDSMLEAAIRERRGVGRDHGGRGGE